MLKWGSEARGSPAKSTPRPRPSRRNGCSTGARHDELARGPTVSRVAGDAAAVTDRCWSRSPDTRRRGRIGAPGEGFSLPLGDSAVRQPLRPIYDVSPLVLIFSLPSTRVGIHERPARSGPNSSRPRLRAECQYQHTPMTSGIWCDEARCYVWHHSQCRRRKQYDD